MAPTATYHHFPSQAAIYQAVVELVWGEATVHLLALVPQPLEADPADALGLMATLFERLGLEGEQAATSFHSYASFMIGAVLFAAARRDANEQLVARAGHDGDETHFHAPYRPKGRATKRTRVSIDNVMDLSVADPATTRSSSNRGFAGSSRASHGHAALRVARASGPTGRGVVHRCDCATRRPR